MSDSEIVQAMVDEPTLIKRPIAATDSLHVIGSRMADLERFVAEAAEHEG